MPEVTELLRAWNEGSLAARDEVLGLVYQPLRDIAGQHLRRERDGHTLQPTALVHELYLKLVQQRSVGWQDRVHFLAVAAQVMRRILVDHARHRTRDKRGGAMIPVAIDEALDVKVATNVDIVRLDDALTDLAGIFPDQARIVELRFYGGLTIDEVATALGISPATVSREWTMARAWLRRTLTSP
jgi:RNA polymerase sigma factor (TIGR02999 family)